MKIATINTTGTVQHVAWIESEQLFQPPPESGLTNINISQLDIDSNELVNNYVYSNNEFIKRPENLPRYYSLVEGNWVDTRDINSVKMYQISMLREINLQKDLENIDYKNAKFQPNMLALQNYYISNLNNPSYTVDWLDVDNVPHTLTLANLAELISLLNTRQEQNFQTYQQLKQQVNSAQTISEVEAIVWPQ